MPRFFFDLVDDTTVYDRKGVSLPNVDEAKKFATTFARELMEAKSTLLGESHDMWSVEVSNGRFERLFRLPFREVTTELHADSKSLAIKASSESV